MTIKMCDLSAHVYRTSYIYKYIYRLPVWLWRVSTYTFLRSLHTRPLQQTINGSCRVSVKHRLGVGVGVHCSFVSFSVLCFGLGKTTENETKEQWTPTPTPSRCFTDTRSCTDRLPLLRSVQTIHIDRLI